MNTLRLFIIRHLSVYYMLIACFAFSLMGAASKLLSEQVSSVEIVLFRNIIGLAFVLAALYRHRNFGKGGAPWLFVFRGVIGSLGLLCFFYNIAHIELGTAFTFQKTAPIFIAIFSYFVLKEKLSKLGWIAILLGFIGIVFIMKPSGNMGLIDSIIGLSGGVCMGL
ncbi:MAG: DMT family transporter, partial [Campylobacter sp.]|nr:DMT family transporter [Campylobacter sp.]